MSEAWKLLKDYPNYMISDRGNVKNIKTDRIINKTYQKSGHTIVCLSNKGKIRTIGVARLMLETFKPRENTSTLSVVFKDNDKRNCILDNIEWSEEGYINRHKKIPKDIKELKNKLLSIIDEWAEQYNKDK